MHIAFLECILLHTEQYHFLYIFVYNIGLINSYVKGCQKLIYSLPVIYRMQHRLEVQTVCVGY
jgi:hypothetical protein